MTIRRRCGTPDPPAGSTVGGTSVCFSRRSFTCCQPVQSRSTNCLCFAPTGSYAVCRIFSRCRTGEGNQCRQRGSPQPGYNFDEGNTRLVRRSHQPWFEFGEGNPRSQRRSPQRRGTHAQSAVPLSRGINSTMEVRVSNAPPPSTMAREPALDAPLPPATRRAAMGLLRRRVALLSERVHPLLFRTRRWRSV